MTAYVTVDDLKLYLKQLEGSTDDDVLLALVIDRAQSIVEGYLGFAYAGWGVASAQTLFTQDTSILTLPPHQAGSITSVTTYGTGAVLIDPTLYEESSQGNLYLRSDYPGAYSLLYGYGARYIVTAIWGYGPAPENVKQVVLELAKDLFFERDGKSTSDIVGIEGSGGVAVGYKGALTKRQTMILDGQKQALYYRVAGVV